MTSDDLEERNVERLLKQWLPPLPEDRVDASYRHLLGLLGESESGPSEAAEGRANSRIKNIIVVAASLLVCGTILYFITAWPILRVQPVSGSGAESRTVPGPSDKEPEEGQLPIGTEILAPGPGQAGKPPVATVERVEGEVQAGPPGGKNPVRAGKTLSLGQDLETVGAESRVVTRMADGTRLELGGNTLLRGLENVGGKRASMTRGELTAAVVKQPAGSLMTLVSPQAQVKVLTTATFKLTVDGTSTRLDVQEGKVRLSRLADGKSIDVMVGHFAVIAGGVELTVKRDLKLAPKPETGRRVEAEREAKQSLEWAVSFRPVTEEDRKTVERLMTGLDDDDYNVRDRSSQELAALGAPAWVLLRKTDLSGRSAEVRGRVQSVLAEMEKRLPAGRREGVEHDVVLLSSQEDARAYERLKRILAAVPPFSRDGFPERGPGLARQVADWWAGWKNRVRWNPEADCFEETRR